MKRKKSHGVTAGHDLSNSMRTPGVSRLCDLLERLDRTLRQAEQVPVLLNPEQLADRLGVNKRTVYRIVANEQIATVRIGNGMRFLPDDVADFLWRYRRLPAALEGGGGGQNLERATL